MRARLLGEGNSNLVLVVVLPSVSLQRTLTSLTTTFSVSQQAHIKGLNR